MPDAACQVHPGIHRSTPLRVVEHHIQPHGMGGESNADNLVLTCDTGHYNIHRLMGDLLHGKPMRRRGTVEEHRLAQLGYDRWVAAGKPGTPVFELDWHPIPGS